MRWRFTGRWLLVGVLPVVCVSCVLPSRNEVQGTYRAEYAFGHETLVLKPAGEYTQRIALKNEAAEVSSRGTWVYDRRSGEITLRGHVMAHDGYCGPNPKLKDPANRWDSTLRVTKSARGHIVMTASADGSGCDYQRVEQEGLLSRAGPELFPSYPNARGDLSGEADAVPLAAAPRSACPMVRYGVKPQCTGEVPGAIRTIPRV
jgi:hypothetical protein